MLGQGVPAGDIDPALIKIEDLTREQNGEVLPASTLQQELALRAPMEFEYKLRDNFKAPEYPELLISEPTGLPDDYEEVVTDYIRKLSQQ